MKTLQDPVWDIFGLLPSDVNYHNRLEQIENELQLHSTTSRMEECFKLYYWQKLSLTEIAKFLGITKSTASRHLSAFRARVRLRYLYLTK